MRTRRSSLALVVAGTMAVAACGGSDGDGALVVPGADADTDSNGSDDAAPADDAVSVDDADGEGSNDETQAGLDDAGVDIDLDELEESLSDFSTGEGGGTVVIDGAEYSFEGQICIAQGSDFTTEGLGTTPDGQPFWGSISASSGFDFDGDGEDDDTITVSVEVGKTELFGEVPDGSSDWFADGFLMDDLTYSLGGGTITGQGPIDDLSRLGDPASRTTMTFRGSCS